MPLPCPYCHAARHGTDDDLRRLLYHQDVQLARVQVADKYMQVADAPPTVSEAEMLPLVESMLAADDIYRRPPRAAAPRMLARLIEAGFTMGVPR